MSKAKKEVQGERYAFEGREFVKIKPITFQNLIKANDLCDDLKIVLIEFAREFGIDKDASLQVLVSFLEDHGYVEWNKNFDWLEKQRFVKEVESKSYKVKTKFWDGNKEIMLISTEPSEMALLDLSTGICWYGTVKTEKGNCITRSELWEFLENFGNEELTKFLSTAH